MRRTPAGDGWCLRELDDGELDVLDAVFDGLSPRSRYLRYHAGILALAPAVRRQLAALGPGHAAIGAFAAAADDEDGSCWPVGLVRLIATGDRQAELAVEVVDSWHRRGIGSQLLQAAKDRAAALGYTHLQADLLTENSTIRTMLRRIFPGASVTSFGATQEMTLPVADAAAAPEDRPEAA